MKKAKETRTERLIKALKNGLRLNTPAPRIEKDKSKYTRKVKHRDEKPE